MSVQAMTWALAQKTGSPGAKAVLICLSNYADGEGRCFPGQRRLAENTEMGERTVRRHLADLEAAGLIGRTHRYRDDGTRTSDEYQLAFNRSAEDATTGQNGRVDEATTGQIKHAYRPNWPGKEPSEEPSDTNANALDAPSASARDRLWKLVDDLAKQRGESRGKIASVVGRCVKLAGGDHAAVLEVAQEAMIERPISLEPWLMAHFRPRDGPPDLPSMDDIRDRFLAEAHEKYG